MDIQEYRKKLYDLQMKEISLKKTNDEETLKELINEKKDLRHEIARSMLKEKNVESMDINPRHKR